MSDASLWWVAAGIIVGLELLTGTFYLLMLALGAAAGALCATFGANATFQIVAAGIVGGLAVLTWHLKRQRSKDHALRDGTANPDLHLDVGQTVDVPQWNPDGSTRVTYRGAQWDARCRGHVPPQPGTHRISAVEGNRLILEKI
ncbi:MAG: NfeD family protein [Burkholderiales bacterium]|nr:NfeD family protein [Burkholderiales bacterium]